MPRSNRRISVAIASTVAVALTACGGGGSPAERSAERQLAEALDDLSDEGVDFDLGDLEDLAGGGSGGISIDSDEGSMAMGVDLDPPEWLPSNYPLPDGFSINAVVSDPEAGNSLTGAAPGSLDDVRADHVAAVRQWGAEIFQDDELVAERLLLSFRSPSDGVLYLAFADMGDNSVYITITFSTEDPDEVEQILAGPRDVLGTAVAQLDGETITAEGNCQIGVSFATFFSASDGTSDEVFVNVNDEMDDTTSINATITQLSTDGNVAIWMLTSQTATGDATQTSIDIEGEFTNMADTSKVTRGSIEVSCP